MQIIFPISNTELIAKLSIHPKSVELTIMIILMIMFMTMQMAYRGDCSAPLDTNLGKIKEAALDHVFLRLRILDNIHTDH